LSTNQNNEVNSAIDQIEDDLFKISAIDLESMNGDPTPTSSMNLNGGSFNDISIVSRSNNSQISPVYPVPRLINLQEIQKSQHGMNSITINK
jgi:hypothetical protein